MGGFNKTFTALKPTLNPDGSVSIPEIEAVTTLPDAGDSTPAADLPPNVAENKQATESQVTKEPGEVGSTMQSFLVADTNWGQSSAARTLTRSEIGRPGALHDNFLDLAAKYWTADSAQGSNAGAAVFLNKSFKPSRELGVPFTMHVGEPVYNPSPSVDNFAESNVFFEVQQGVKLFADKGQFLASPPRPRNAIAPKKRKGVYMPSKWKELLIGNSDPQSATYDPSSLGIFKEYEKYDYCAFRIPLPHNEKELEKLMFSGQHHVSIKPEYNFFIYDYERILVKTPEGQSLSERSLPNLYAIMLEKENEISNKYFHNHITLGGTLQPHQAGSIDGANKEKYDIRKHSGQYFEAYARAIAPALGGAASIPLPTIGNKFKNIIVPGDTLSKLKSISDRKEIFPAFVDIEISMDKTTAFTNMLKETYLLDRFILEAVKAAERVGKISGEGFIPKKFVEARESIALVEQDDGAMTSAKNVSYSTEDRRTWDITEWLQGISLIDFKTGAYSSLGNSEGDSQLLGRSIVLDDGITEEAQMMEPQNKFFHSLMSVVFLSKLKQLLKSRFRTYDDLMRGKTNYSETVLYRIEKWATNADGIAVGSEPIQNYWVPNDSEMDVARIVDTQVKHGARYKYTIYAYQVVVASQYAYSKVQVANSTASMVVTQTPMVLLVEQEVYTETRIIMDSPPVPPEAQIIPYRADKHNLLINLNTAIGDYLLHPVALSEVETAATLKIREAQKLNNTEPVRYKNDDSVGEGGFFEIFRTTTHPKAWSDFEGNPPERIALNRDFGAKISASSASFRDRIKPNQKYYYMFRMHDAHGHVSNPTDMYEVELVYDRGTVHFLKRVVGFAHPEPRLPSKPMRRLIEIKPAYLQQFADISEEFDSALDVNDVKMGEPVSPWGKRYKLRFVSKKTGKKIDLNIALKIKVEKGLPEGK